MFVGNSADFMQSTHEIDSNSTTTEQLMHCPFQVDFISSCLVHIEVIGSMYVMAMHLAQMGNLGVVSPPAVLTNEVDRLTVVKVCVTVFFSISSNNVIVSNI